MKVLALSLLRLGDIFMHLHVLNTYKRHNPTHQITLMINEQFRHAEHLILSLSKVERIIYFDRTAIQQGLLDKNSGQLYSYQKLSKLTEEVQELKIDRLLNLTHNQLSARLVDLFAVGDVKGIGYQDGKVIGLQSLATKYFNEHYSEDINYSFHYVDILKQILELQVDCVQTSDEFLAKKICIQVFSAEEKKEHNTQFWCDLISVLRATGCTLPIYVICSPSEIERTSLMRLQLQNIENLHFVAPSLNELVSYLMESVLITVDTSIKHIASHLETRIVEISLGSSNPVKTSAYAAGAWILHSARSCAPCSHSRSCHQPEYFCRQDLLPQDVAITVMQIIKEIKLEDAKTILSPQAQVFTTFFDEAGILELAAFKGSIAEKISDQAYLEKAKVKVSVNHTTPVMRRDNESGA